MPDSSIIWDHDSFVDHAGWLEAHHSSAWDSHEIHSPPDPLLDPVPDPVTTTHQARRGNINLKANIGSVTIETTKRSVSTVGLSATSGLGVKTEQGSDGITSPIVLEDNQNYTSTTIGGITNSTDAYSITESYDIPNVGAARAPAQPQGFFDQHRVFVFSGIAVSAVILIVAVALLIVILRRSRRKKQKQVTLNSTKAPTSKGVRRLVKMESQESQHTYEEVQLHKKDDNMITMSSLDTRITPSAAISIGGGKSDPKNANIEKSGKGPLYFELDESSGQPTIPVYSTPISKRTYEFSAKTDVEKTGVYRMYSEPIPFTKTKEQAGDKVQENVRYSTPAPTYFIVDPSQYQEKKISAGTTLPRRMLTRQCDVTIEKYDKLDRSFKMTSSSPVTCSGDTGKEKTSGLVSDDMGPYDCLNRDQNTANMVKSSSSSPIAIDSPPKEKSVSGIFEAKGYNTLAF